MANVNWGSRPDPTSKDGTRASRGSVLLIVGGSVLAVALVMGLLVFGIRAIRSSDSAPAATPAALSMTPPDGKSAGEIEKLRQRQTPPPLDATSGLDYESTGLPAVHQQQALAYGQVVARLTPGPARSADKPQGLTWKPFGNLNWLAVSPQTGPTTMTGHCTSGFARTIAGAAVAASQLLNRGIMFKECGQAAGLPASSDEQYWNVLRPSLANGGVTATQAAKAPAGIGRVTFSPESGPLERVDIELIQFMPGTGTSAMAIPAVVRWKNGDWRLTAEKSQFDQGETEGSVPSAWTSWIN